MAAVKKTIDTIDKINSILLQVENLLKPLSASIIISIPGSEVIADFSSSGERLKILEYIKIEMELDKMKRERDAERLLYKESKDTKKTITTKSEKYIG